MKMISHRGCEGLFRKDVSMGFLKHQKSVDVQDEIQVIWQIGANSNVWSINGVTCDGSRTVLKIEKQLDEIGRAGCRGLKKNS